MKWSDQAPLRVALLDDHAIIRNGFKHYLEQERDIEVVAVYSGSRELLADAGATQIDVLVMDYSMRQNELDGLNLIRMLRIRLPTVRILVFSSMESLAIIGLCLKTGARGFIGKSEPVEELLHAIRHVAREKIYLSRDNALELGHSSTRYTEGVEDPGEADICASKSPDTSELVNHVSLSPREQEVLRCSLEGLSVSQIGRKFNRSRKTISAQKQSAFRKLGVRSDMELFKIRGVLNA
ncbi:response regulator transcription factor [Pseudomonas vranovensis]|uniref:response regulator transcription factor n=1 Tax=Pseudomonas vranovensis TaxID=321661 RepID=UPI000410FF85|nr:response regulator transcription factor [Pseudomonas vranovensis]